MSTDTATKNRMTTGILNVDKPYGITSMDVVRRIKRASGVKRVGHGGTLDPIATGVIPICLGQATRMMEYLIEGGKRYEGVIELGVTTDTYDALGQITATCDPSFVTPSSIETALTRFVGAIDQVPPMFSALKQQGKRLYELARAGVEVERKPRKVEVRDIAVLDWSPPLVKVDVNCGRGFYMRSLAFDLGTELGCGANLKSLRRLRNGPFDISDALPLEEAEELLSASDWRSALYTPDIALENLRAIVASDRIKDMITHGRPLSSGFRIPSARQNELSRVYDTEGRFIAILKFDASIGEWHPNKVFLSDEVNEEF